MRTGAAPGAFAGWGAVIDQARRQGATAQSGLGGLARSSAAAGGGQRGRRAVVGAAGGGLRRGSGIPVSESLAPGPGLAVFANRTEGLQNHVAAETAEPRVPTTGAARKGMVAAQLIDTAPKTRPDEPNHLNCNATAAMGAHAYPVCGGWHRHPPEAERFTGLWDFPAGGGPYGRIGGLRRDWADSGSRSASGRHTVVSGRQHGHSCPCHQEESGYA